VKLRPKTAGWLLSAALASSSVQAARPCCGRCISRTVLSSTSDTDSKGLLSFNSVPLLSEGPAFTWSRQAELQPPLMSVTLYSTKRSWCFAICTTSCALCTTRTSACSACCPF
jgi:hypothetical protein